jgi:hypothetical protein
VLEAVGLGAKATASFDEDEVGSDEVGDSTAGSIEKVSIDDIPEE